MADADEPGFALAFIAAPERGDRDFEVVMLEGLSADEHADYATAYGKLQRAFSDSLVEYLYSTLLDAEQLASRIAGAVLTTRRMPAPWELSVWETEGDDWEFDSAANDSPEELYEFWDTSVARSRAAVAAIEARGGLDAPSAFTWPDGSQPNVRRMLMDLVEEYGRHTGHADILREAVDGRTGEDPPWPASD